jgi:hypothetical protein
MQLTYTLQNPGEILQLVAIGWLEALPFSQEEGRKRGIHQRK